MTRLSNTATHSSPIKRIDTPDPVVQFMDNLRDTHTEIEKLFNELEFFGELILLGGAIRDLIHDVLPRDFDIVVNTTEDLDCLFMTLPHSKNRFGGYKINLCNYEFDIWSIKNNWAFRENILDPSFENITKGVFYNFDAITLNLNTKDLDADYFNRITIDYTLDIILKDETIHFNPTPEVNIVRAAVLKKKWGLGYSDRVKNYISGWVYNNKQAHTLLKKAEKKHYGHYVLTDDDYDNILQYSLV